MSQKSKGKRFSENKNEYDPLKKDVVQINHGNVEMSPADSPFFLSAR